MKGAPAGSTEPLNIGWGTGGVAGGPFTAANTDIALFSEAAEARTAGTSSAVTTTTTNDTYQVTGTITATGARTITEVALSDSTTKPFSTTWSTAPTGTGGTTGTLAASYTPANNTYIQCRTEVMQVTAGTGTTSVTISRAQNGSTAVTQSNGDQVTLGNPPGTATANATLFLHADHGSNTLATNDSIAYTIQVAFS
jgi:hypothetical protein